MRKLAKLALAAGLIATSSLGLIAPAAAEAHDGDAVIAGILGLGIGAAIASDHHYHHHYYRRYYYAPPPRYYAPPAYYYAPQPYGYYAPSPHYYYRYDDDDD